MDDLTLMRGFRAERVKRNPVTRGEARRALEARFATTATATPAVAPARWRGTLFGGRRRLLALAAATALAAVLAGVLVIGSGPTAQPAAAEVLRETAAVAAGGGGQAQFPGPGQYLYSRTESTELQSWLPGEYTLGGGRIEEEGAFSAFVTWREEFWRSTEAPARHRWVLMHLRFLSGAERSRWKQAGSPLPSAYNGAAERRGFPGSHVLEARRGVIDVEGEDGPGYGQFSGLPTEPRPLRSAIERRQHGPVDAGQVIAELWEILDKANSGTALRAAVFGALAEEPGIELNRNAKDLVGRPGYALSYESHRRSDYQQQGIRVEYIFDPETSAVLGRRELIADPKKVAGTKGIAPGSVRREVADLEQGVVDSTRERPASSADIELARPRRSRTGGRG